MWFWCRQVVLFMGFWRWLIPGPALHSLHWLAIRESSTRWLCWLARYSTNRRRLTSTTCCRQWHGHCSHRLSQCQGQGLTSPGALSLSRLHPSADVWLHQSITTFKQHKNSSLHPPVCLVNTLLSVPLHVLDYVALFKSAITFIIVDSKAYSCCLNTFRLHTKSQW